MDNAGDDDLKAFCLVLDDIVKRLPSRDARSSFARMLEPGKRTKTHHYFLLPGELLALQPGAGSLVQADLARGAAFASPGPRSSADSRLTLCQLSSALLALATCCVPAGSL
jgi:hypothetical protein